MYPASTAFHTAVANGNEQKALLIFDDCVFTDDDISVEDGIEFHDYFNTEEDIAIGQTPSNEISFSLFNDDRLLNDYEFGDFIATLGVYLETENYTHSGTAKMVTSSATYIGKDTFPYLTRNGIALQTPPTFAVNALAGYDGKVWAFGANGAFKVYNDSNGSDVTSAHTLNNFMKKKVKTWVGKGIYYNQRILNIFQNGKKKKYEFVPLGCFTAERPNAPDVILINMTCYDWMQKFEEDMPDATALGITYPATIGTLYTKMCNYLGVSYETATFINSAATISAKPDDFDNATMRDVLKWIAEAAGSNARFDRDGVLKLDWLRTTTQSYDESGYSDFNPYWYETKQITKLHNRSTQESTETTYGTGDEAYLIQDNPLLRGVR